MGATRPAHSPQSILIVKLSAIGDVAQSLFVLPALRRAFPAARLGWVAARGPHELLLGQPQLDRLHVFERQRWAGVHGALAHVGEIRDFFKEVRAENYDLVIDLQGLARSGLITLLSGAPRRLGFARAREFARMAYTERLDTGLRIRRAVDRYAELAALAGASADPEERALVGHESMTRVDALLGEHTSRRLIALQPGARWESKRWPIEHFVSLARALVAAGFGVVVIGAADELEITRVVAAAAPGIVNLASVLALQDLPALLCRVELLVTCDSGPMHIAAAVGAPVLAIFGPTDPRRTGPVGRASRVLRRDEPCSPCLSRTCLVGHHGCMRRIEPSEVLAAVVGICSRQIIAGGETQA